MSKDTHNKTDAISSGSAINELALLSTDQLLTIPAQPKIDSDADQVNSEKISSSNVVTEPATEEDCADYIVRYLEALGVEYVFGIPGGNIEPFYNALARAQRRGTLKHVVARHESGAVFMAEGYYRETGKLGVVCTTTGPGATNAITGVANAYIENAALLIITAQNTLASFGRNTFQDSSAHGINLISIFASITGFNHLISSTDQLPRLLQKAVVSAFKNGPSHLSIPPDIFKAKSGNHISSNDILRNASLKILKSIVNFPLPSNSAGVKLLSDQLQSAVKGFFYLGPRAYSASPLIVKLAERLNWPIVTSPAGKGCVSSYHPLYYGVYGVSGHLSAQRIVEDDGVELVLVCGADLGEVDTLDWKSSILCSEKVHHIDHLPKALEDGVGSKHTLLMDFNLLFESLLATTPTRIKSSLIGRMTPIEIAEPTIKKTLHQKMQRIRPNFFMSWLSLYQNKSAAFYFDAGNSLFWAINCFQTNPSVVHRDAVNHFNITLNFCSMGWALPAATGAALANQDKTIVAVLGDGAYLMSGQELTVAKEFGINLIVFVLNDGKLGSVHHGQRLGGAEKIACDLPVVDFCLQGKSLGVNSLRICNEQELDALKIENLMAIGGVHLIELMIDSEVSPPLLGRIKKSTKVQSLYASTLG